MLIPFNITKLVVDRIEEITGTIAKSGSLN